MKENTLFVLGMIADHPTPKVKVGGAAYTIESRDYKGVMIVALSKGDNPKPVDATRDTNSRQ